jgi:hypothetical protein
MKLIDNILYLEFSELVDCGVNEETLKKAKLRKSNSWSFINDPMDNRRVLVEYEKLGNSYKEKVKARFGNPYDYIAREPIKNMVKWDHLAEQFYLGHRYEGNKTLPVEHVAKYTKAASWLNMLKEVTDDKKALKKLLRLTIDEFYVHVLELIKTETVDLPTSYRRLLAKRKEYEERGYGSLINWQFGNKKAAKINDELSESVLLEMIAHPNQYDDVLIQQQYNKWAEAHGYKTIDHATVGHHRRKNNHLVIMSREGNAALNEKYLKQVKGHRPSHPLAMLELDDNHIDLQFIDIDTGSKYARYKAIVLIDSFNDYVLGYAYTTDAVTIELVKLAYVSAMYYVRSLTGAWYLPHETKTDNFGIGTLKSFYESIGNYVKTPVGSKHRGYIEPFFGSSHWKRCLKLGANNYTGNNITAKHQGVNIDFVRREVKNRPVLGKESIDQVEQFFHRLRHMPMSNGVSKHSQWMEAWEKMPSEKKRLINVEHNYRGEGYRINNRGVEPQINGTKYSYNLQEYDMAHIGKSVSIIYDPFDMSRILVTDYDKVRVMAHEANLQSRALTDAHFDSRKYLNMILAEKKDSVETIASKSDKRKKVLQAHTVDAEAMLLSGVMLKDLKQEAEQIYLGESQEFNQKKEQQEQQEEQEYNPFDQL